MKRIIALMLTLLMVVALSACTMGTDGTTLNQNTSETSATEAPKVDIEKYEKDFDGMQAYLIELELLSGDEDDKIETQADVIGAKTGVRYQLDTTNFVEFYEFDTAATPDEAVSVYDAISNGETYKVLGIEALKGEVSSSGKFIMLYPATSTYDFSELAEEFEKF